MRNQIRNPKSAFRNCSGGPDAENERSDESDRTLRFGQFSSCDAGNLKRVPWVLLLRTGKNKQQTKEPLRRIESNHGSNT
jgi:hypothetical protein